MTRRETLGRVKVFQTLATVVRATIRAIARPLYRRRLREIPFWGLWEELPVIPINYQAFGRGSTRPFEWYFQGTTTAPVTTLDDLCAWLVGCVYVSDYSEFGTFDLWQHPTEFEDRRRGDCDDHALWAWRKLIELGLPAQLFSGTWMTSLNPTSNRHIWLVFRGADGVEYLVESIAKMPSQIIRPLESVRSAYIPFFSVDANFATKCYGGFVEHLRRSEGLSH